MLVAPKLHMSHSSDGPRDWIFSLSYRTLYASFSYSLLLFFYLTEIVGIIFNWCVQLIASQHCSEFGGEMMEESSRADILHSHTFVGCIIKSLNVWCYPVQNIAPSTSSQHSIGWCSHSQHTSVNFRRGLVSQDANISPH